MSKYKKQSHVIYKCDYDIVWFLINEDQIRSYVKYQEEEERKEESNQQGFDFDLGT